MKTKFLLLAAISIDGKISNDTKNMPDWTSKEDWKQFQKILSKCDAVLVGRKTFEVAKTYIEKRNAFVLSRKKIASYGTVKFVDPRKMDIKIVLRSYYKVGIVGGSEVYQFALKNRLADEIFLTIEPIILGSGISFIKGSLLKIRNAVLKSSKMLNKKGTMLLHYKLK